MLYFGVDIGGTNIKAAVVGEDGSILCQSSRPTALPRSAEEICESIADQLNALAEECGRGSEIAGAGIGCPGTVDDRTGRVVYANNLHWVDMPLRDELEKRLHLPVTIGNDANAAAFGEAVAGCGKGADSAVFLTLGTGVGGGVVLNGRLLTGFTGAASEAGHMVIVENGEPCTCGRRGCFEAYASATALIRMTREAMQAHPESRMCALAREHDVTGQTAFAAAAEGDAAAEEVVRTYRHYLAVGIANLINIFFPELVGLSGGVANQGETLLKPLREEIAQQVYGAAYASQMTRIVSCSLGYHAGVIGAAMLAKSSGRTLPAKEETGCL